MRRKFTLIWALLFVYYISSAQPTVTLVPYATGFTNLISDIAHTNDSRLFVVEQMGYISIVDSSGNVSPRYFLDINSKVTPTNVSSGGEQGLLGMAFSPNYATDGFIYINYTNKTGVGNSVIARYQVSSDPDSIDVNSEEILLTVYQPFTNHNGGCLKFGADGYLYCALGDGGDGGDPGNRAQNTDSLLGKILRIDVSGTSGYAIPASNPFANGGGAPEIWAYGLRNPWRFSFDRLNNSLWIADVGQDDWEEIDVQAASSTGGENYGWRCYEGINHPYNTTGCGGVGSYVAPVHDYSHSATSGCSVTGGFVYRGNDYPSMYGYYFFADYCNGKIYSLSSTYASATAATYTGKFFVTFGENSNGELFIGDQSANTVYKLTSIITSVATLSADVISFNISPNPVKDIMICNVNAKSDSKMEISVIDAKGSVYQRNGDNIKKGENNYSLDVSTLTNGFYIVQLKTESGISYTKFQVIQ